MAAKNPIMLSARLFKLKEVTSDIQAVKKIIRKPGYCWQTVGVPFISKVISNPHLGPHMTLAQTNAISQLHYAYFPGWQSLRGRDKPRLRSAHFTALVLGAARLCSGRGFWVTCNSETRMNQPTLSPKKSHYQQFSQFHNKAPEDKWASSWRQSCLFFPLFLQAGYTKDLK